MTLLRIDKSVFNPSHLPLINDTEHKYLIVYGGSGSGKSVAIAQKLLIKALNSKRRILIMRKTLRSQKDSCFKLWKQLITQWKISHLATINKTDYSITFSNGSEILFYGCDDTGTGERWKSLVDISDCHCEECTELTADEFDQICLRVRANVPNIQIICSFNPVSKANWVYKRWFQEGVKIPEDTVIFHSTYKDNKFLPENYIKDLERMIESNPTYFRIYTLGEFCSLEKLVYTNWKVQEFDQKTLQGQHIVGMDFGFVNDLSTIVDSIVDTKERIIYVCRTWGRTGYTNNELAEVIKTLGLAKSDIVADSAEPKSIEELRRAGISRIRKSIKGPDSIKYGIQKVQQYRIIVHPDCEGIITELENYHWRKNKEGELISEPADEFNHYLDGLRYSLQLIEHKSLTVLDKKLLGV